VTEPILKNPKRMGFKIGPRWRDYGMDISRKWWCRLSLYSMTFKNGTSFNRCAYLMILTVFENPGESILQRYAAAATVVLS